MFLLRISISILLAIILSACTGNAERKSMRQSSAIKIPHRDLAEIKASGELVALTDFSSSSYFIFKGVPMGFEFELLERFCDHIGVELTIRIVHNMDDIIEQLNANEGDVIAANYTVTNRRKRKVAFTQNILQTRQVLVQRLPDFWWTMTSDQLDLHLVKTPSQLIGKKIHVRRESSFYTRLLNLMDEIGAVFEIEFAEGIGTEKLIEMVSKGDIDYTVADENIAILNKVYFNNIDVRTPLSFTQNVAWACRKSSPQLLASFNIWFEDFRKSEEFAVIHLKYFKARTQHKARVMSEYSSLSGGKISPYDALIKAEAQRLGWDWKLLAALIYQESKFEADARAWTGAGGLMQLIPETAQRFGADSLDDPNQNVHAGVSFLISLREYWEESLEDSNAVIPFTLASYNVGLGHVLDAQRLAEKNGQDSENWESVAYYLELKAQPQYYNDPVVKHGYCRGAEPVEYVRSILGLWQHYLNAPI